MEEKKNLSPTFMVLAIVYITCLLLSNLIAGKMWAVTSSVTLPAAVILFPLTYILGDAFTEVYGFQKARAVIWAGFASCFFAVLVGTVTVALPHPASWANQDAFATVLGNTPRVAAASFIGYLFGQFSNAVIMSEMKTVTKGSMLWVRSILSTLVGEGLDSIIFIMVSFYGTMPTSALWQMVLFQYLFKVCYEALCTPLLYAAVSRLNKIEGTEPSMMKKNTLL